MNIQWTKIYEGWRNKLIPPEKIKKLIEKTAAERMSICNTCDYNSSVRKNYKTLRPDVHCLDCGCTLSAKTRCLSCDCGLKKWLAVLTEDQEENINSHET